MSPASAYESSWDHLQLGVRECRVCQRPLPGGWRACGWCGALEEQSPQRVLVRLRMARAMLLLHLTALVASLVTLSVVWGVRAWSSSEAQMLGVLWFGVLGAVVMLVWVNATIAQAAPAPRRLRPA